MRTLIVNRGLLLLGDFNALAYGKNILRHFIINQPTNSQHCPFTPLTQHVQDATMGVKKVNLLDL
jgi:hypothetical protein